MINWYDTRGSELKVDHFFDALIELVLELKERDDQNINEILGGYDIEFYSNAIENKLRISIDKL